MALRFRRTVDVSPHIFSTRERADHDWLLYCGGLSGPARRLGE
jgi:hypothetical protein